MSSFFIRLYRLGLFLTDRVGGLGCGEAASTTFVSDSTSLLPLMTVSTISGTDSGLTNFPDSSMIRCPWWIGLPSLVELLPTPPAPPPTSLRPFDRSECEIISLVGWVMIISALIFTIEFSGGGFDGKVDVAGAWSLMDASATPTGDSIGWIDWLILCVPYVQHNSRLSEYTTNHNVCPYFNTNILPTELFPLLSIVVIVTTS